MAVAVLQQQHTQLIKQREELIFQLDLKYNNYIHTLLQQKITIIAQITNKYDQLINNVNDSIYNKISTNMNHFMEQQIVTAMHISNSLQPETEETSESLNTVGNINNETTETITFSNKDNDNNNRNMNAFADDFDDQNQYIFKSNHNQSASISPDPVSLESIQQDVSNSSKKHPRRFRHRLKLKKNNNNSSKPPGIILHPLSLENIKQFKIKNSCITHSKNSNSPKRRSQRLQFRNSSNPKPFVFTKHKCSKCNVLFSCQKKLANHMKAHAKEKRFICTGCGRKFATQYGLNNHEKIHRFECSDCPQWYFRKEDLEKHILTHFIFKCNECSKSFKSQSHLDYHIKVHLFFKSHHLEPPCLEPPT